MSAQIQGKTEKNIINQDRTQTRSTELESPKAGTATSSPISRIFFQIIWFLAMPRVSDELD
jgi:hypothetical protein